MRIFLGTTDICGILPIYKKAFENIGHIAHTGVFIHQTSAFYDNSYDYYLTSTYANHISSKYKNRIVKSILYRTINLYERILRLNAKERIIEDIITSHDLFVFFWSEFNQGYSEYKYLKEKKKKIICVFVGSDIRYFNAFAQEFDVSFFTFPKEYSTVKIDTYIEKLRVAEKYCDSIYSVPDQSTLALRPYFHYQMPVDSDKYEFKITANEIPVIVHAPSRPWLKGSEIIEATIERLNEEGLNFEYVSVRNMKNEDLLKLLTRADILVDEIILHGPGLLSFEAMSSGCAVATRYLEDSPECFRPPVININESNIYEKLKMLILDKRLREEIIVQAESYIKESNKAENIVQQMMNNLESNSEHYDYIPLFMRNQYIPKDELEVANLNSWTEYVKDCNWYKKYIKAGKRDGFNF